MNNLKPSVEELAIIDSETSKEEVYNSEKWLAEVTDWVEDNDIK